MTRVPELLGKLMPRLSPSVYPVFPLLRLQALLFTTRGSPEDLQKAAITLSIAYPGAEALHPPGHPTLAVILAEWAKILSTEPNPDASKDQQLQKLYQAVALLRKAYTACERGFGPGGGLVGKEMEGLIRGCEGEIGLLRSAAV
jgi:SET and MYND domain-containing protein